MNKTKSSKPKNQKTLTSLNLIQYRNKDIYCGTTHKNKKTGIGYFKTKDETTYKGEFSKNTYNGIGLLNLQKGNENYYLGEFKGGKRHGVGKIFFKSFEYLGEFKEGKMTGIAEVIDENGIRHRGNFYEGVKYGYGEVENLYSKYFFKGYFQSGSKTGMGIERLDNREFIGNFKNNQKNGLGIITQNEKVAFIGNFENSHKTGFCRYNLKKDQFFEGTVELDVRNGYGKMVNVAKGLSYIGEYKDNKMHGYGELRTNNSVYFGFFKGGSRSGLGYMTNDKDQSFYFGNWKKDKKHGYGLEQVNGKRMRANFHYGIYHGEAVVYSSADFTKAVSFVEFKKGSFSCEITEKHCQELMNVNFDYAKFKKEMNQKVENLNFLIQENKSKLKFNVARVIDSIEKEELMLHSHLDRIKIHYYGIKFGFQKIEKKLNEFSTLAKVSIPHSDIQKESKILENDSIKEVHDRLPQKEKEILNWCLREFGSYKNSIRGGKYVNLSGSLTNKVEGPLALNKNYSMFPKFEHPRLTRYSIYSSSLASNYISSQKQASSAEKDNTSLRYKSQVEFVKQENLIESSKMEHPAGNENYQFGGINFNHSSKEIDEANLFKKKTVGRIARRKGNKENEATDSDLDGKDFMDFAKELMGVDMIESEARRRNLDEKVYKDENKRLRYDSGKSHSGTSGISNINLNIKQINLEAFQGNRKLDRISKKSSEPILKPKKDISRKQTELEKDLYGDSNGDLALGIDEKVGNFFESIDNMKDMRNETADFEVSNIVLKAKNDSREVYSPSNKTTPLKISTHLGERLEQNLSFGTETGKNDFNNLKERYASLMTKYENKTKENNDLREKVKELNKKNYSLIDSIGSRSNFQDLKKRSDANLNRKVEELEKETLDLKSELKEKDFKNKQLEKKLETHQAFFEAEKKKFKEEKDSFIEVESKLKQKLDHYQENNLKLGEALKQKKEQFDALETVLKLTNSKNRKTKEESDNTHSKKLEKIQNENSNFKKEISDLRAELVDVTNDKNALERIKQKEYQNYKDDFEKLENEKNEKIEQKDKELERNEKFYKMKIENLEQKINIQKKAEKAFIDETKEISNKKDAHLEEAKSRIHNLEKEIREKDTKFDEYKRKQQEKLQKAKQQIEEQETRIAENEKELESKELKLEQSHLNDERLTAEIRELKHARDERMKELEIIKMDKKAIQKKVEECTSKFVELRFRAAYLISKNEKGQNEHKMNRENMLNEEIKQIKQIFENSEKENCKLHKAIGAKDDEINELKHELSGIKEKHASEIKEVKSSFDTEREALKTTIIEHKNNEANRERDFSKEIENLKSKIENKDEEITELQANHEKLISSLHHDLDILKQERDKLRETLQKKKEEFEEKVTEIEKLESKISEKDDKIFKLENLNSELNSDLSKKEDEFLMLKESNIQLENEIIYKEEALEQLKKKELEQNENGKIKEIESKIKEEESMRIKEEKMRKIAEIKVEEEQNKIRQERKRRMVEELRRKFADITKERERDKRKEEERKRKEEKRKRMDREKRANEMEMMAKELGIEVDGLKQAVKENEDEIRMRSNDRRSALKKFNEDLEERNYQISALEEQLEIMKRDREKAKKDFELELQVSVQNYLEIESPKKADKEQNDVLLDTKVFNMLNLDSPEKKPVKLSLETMRFNLFKEVEGKEKPDETKENDDKKEDEDPRKEEDIKPKVFKNNFFLQNDKKKTNFFIQNDKKSKNPAENKQEEKPKKKEQTKEEEVTNQPVSETVTNESASTSQEGNKYSKDNDIEEEDEFEEGDITKNDFKFKNLNTVQTGLSKAMTINLLKKICLELTQTLKASISF